MQYPTWMLYCHGRLRATGKSIQNKKKGASGKKPRLEAISRIRCPEEIFLKLYPVSQINFIRTASDTQLTDDIDIRIPFTTLLQWLLRRRLNQSRMSRSIEIRQDAMGPKRRRQAWGGLPSETVLTSLSKVIWHVHRPAGLPCVSTGGHVACELAHRAPGSSVRSRDFPGAFRCLPEASGI